MDYLIQGVKDLMNGESNHYTQAVKEFNRLIRHISKGKVQSITEFDKIAQNADLLITNIELEKLNPKEAESFNISKETAIANLDNLKKLIEAIKNYRENQIINKTFNNVKVFENIWKLIKNKNKLNNPFNNNPRPKPKR